MCFLKKFEQISALPLSKAAAFEETDAYSSDDSTFVQKNDDAFLNSHQILNLPQKQNHQQTLMNLISLLNFNSVLMNSLEKVINSLIKKINENNETLEDLQTQMVSNTKDDMELKSTEAITSQKSFNDQKQDNLSDEVLTQKLFGKKSYKYKLKLTEEFAQIIYKERNISFSVALTTPDGQTIRNSNIIHLCLGVCDNNGEWISETRNGETFMKGKTQAELYHGESNYSKIYPRDVSRGYQGGKLNFVIYPKPSMLYYSGNSSSLEAKVNYDEIEPLLIKDLTIRAKKKD